MGSLVDVIKNYRALLAPATPELAVDYICRYYSAIGGVMID